MPDSENANRGRAYIYTTAGLLSLSRQNVTLGGLPDHVKIAIQDALTKGFPVEITKGGQEAKGSRSNEQAMEQIGASGEPVRHAHGRTAVRSAADQDGADV